MKVYYGKSITSGFAEGPAIVSQSPIAFLGSFDPNTGKIIEKGHPLEGVDISKGILIVYATKGSTASIYPIYEAKINNKAPKGILTSAKDTIIIIGAIESNIPAILLDKKDLDNIKTDNYVKMNATKGRVEVY